MSTYIVQTLQKELMKSDAVILCFVDRASLYNLINKANMVHNFRNMFISFLYLFRATLCPSSAEITVFMRHLVLVILYG